jgi:small subunit ribosomal protein S18
MARGGGGNDRERRRAPKDTARRGKKKVCIFCKEHIEWVDYKDVNLLRRFMSDRGKIRARRVSGNCAQHQRDVAVAIKTARELVLLPYTQRTVAERTGPRVRRDSGPRADVEAPASVDDDVDVDDLDVDDADVDDGAVDDGGSGATTFGGATPEVNGGVTPDEAGDAPAAAVSEPE